MKVELWSVGKVRNRESTRWMQAYHERIRKYHPVHLEEIMIREKSAEPGYLKKAESDRILSRLAADDYLVLWDENGAVLTSPELARFLEVQMMNRIRRMIFLIGGAYGFDPSVYERAQHQISLSRMTFPHDMARLMAMEQLYRAFSILHHSPYHH